MLDALNQAQHLSEKAVKAKNFSALKQAFLTKTLINPEDISFKPGPQI